MNLGALAGDECSAHAIRPLKDGAMTRKEKTAIVDRMLDRYRDLGGLIVGDDAILCRLLTTLEIDAEDREIGNYLRSFLVA
jgi:hypothetical protein